MILALLLFLLMPHAVPVAADAPPDVNAILSATESFFQTMKSREYPKVFAALSAKSKDAVVDETVKAIAAGGAAPARPKVFADFEAGGPLARQYWDAFLRRFNPDDALERSLWEMGKIEKERAEVLITRIGSERPAVLKMSLEKGAWKAGLVETFGSR